MNYIDKVLDNLIKKWQWALPDVAKEDIKKLLETLQEQHKKELERLRDECIGTPIGNDKDSSELDIEFLHGKASGYSQKRQEVLEIFNKRINR